MKTLFLLESNDSFIINNKIYELIKKYNIASSSVIKYDLNTDNLSLVIDELNSFTIFDTQKLVIGYNATFLSSSKDLVKHNTKALEDYVLNQNNNLLFLITDKLDNRKKLVKSLTPYFTLISPSVDITSIIKSKCSDYQIKDDVIKYLIEYLRNDYYLIVNSIEKLKNYKYNEKVITIPDINNVILKNIDDNIFHLIDSIISEDYEEVFNIYNKLIGNNEEITKIIILIYKQIRRIYVIKNLSLSFNNYEIGLKLKLPPFVISKLVNTSLSFSNEKLLNGISLLSEYDIGIKTGKHDPNLVFYLFIFNFMSN